MDTNKLIDAVRITKIALDCAPRTPLAVNGYADTYAVAAYLHKVQKGLPETPTPTAPQESVNPQAAAHSFAETLALLTANIYGHEPTRKQFIAQRSGTMGKIEMLNEIISWAHEFEALHKGEQWEELDWYDTIEEFLNTKS